MFTTASLNKFNDRPTITKPLGVRCRELLQDIHIELPPVHIVEYKIPPWIIRQPKVNLECTSFRKSETNPQVYQNMISNIINRYRPVRTIYTDGSKSNSGVGAAVVGEGEIWKGSLNVMCSIYTAELTALYQALTYVDQNSRGSYLICSDSLSSLQSIRDNFSTDPLAQKIIHLYHVLQQQSKIIIFVWTPGHVGISGNQAADISARCAAANASHELPIRGCDLKNALKKGIYKLWQNEWETSNTQLRKLCQTTHKFESIKNMTRKEQVVLTRLRIGHTHLTSSYLLLGQRRPICERCQEFLTVEHILCHCLIYRNELNSLQIPSNLDMLNSKNIFELRKLFQFLKNIGLFYKI
nr:unnamed protein product [Callosobruchus analis]